MKQSKWVGDRENPLVANMMAIHRAAENINATATYTFQSSLVKIHQALINMVAKTEDLVKVAKTEDLVKVPIKAEECKNMPATLEDIWQLLLSEGHLVGLRAAARLPDHIHVLGETQSARISVVLEPRTLLFTTTDRDLTLHPHRFSVLAALSTLTGSPEWFGDCPGGLHSSNPGTWLGKFHIQTVWRNQSPTAFVVTATYGMRKCRTFKLSLNGKTQVWEIHDIHSLIHDKVQSEPILMITLKHGIGVSEARVLTELWIARKFCDAFPTRLYLAPEESNPLSDP